MAAIFLVLGETALAGPAALGGTGAGDVVRIQSAMVRALLATLVLSPNQFLSGDRIAGLVWDAPPPSAQANLRKYAAALRSLFAGMGLAERLQSGRQRGYRLLAGPTEIDAERFATLAQEGRAALRRQSLRPAADILTRALAGWRGEAGHDLPLDSTIGRRVRALNEERLAVAGHLIDARMALGETSDVVAELRAIVVAQPLHERAWEQLIQALAGSGRPAAALAAYAQARAAIRAELGIEPSGRLRDLQHALLTGAH